MNESETGLLPCPACAAVRRHPMRKIASTSWRDGCRDTYLPHGHWFETVQAVARCAACGHRWEMERHYNAVDHDMAGIIFRWRYPDGRVYCEWDKNEPAFLEYDPKEPL